MSVVLPTTPQELAALKLRFIGTPIQGPRGYSAYQLAVQNGFVGTEIEWLNSLNGDEVFLRKTSTEIQWKLGVDGVWETLVPLADIKGDPVNLRKSTTAIQWQQGIGPWNDLVPLLDIKGDTGATPNLKIGNVSQGVPGASPEVTITGTAENPNLNFVMPQGATGPRGFIGPQGWSAVHVLVNDGERRVLQVKDWTGGEGTKPATGQYLGSNGWVDSISMAVDVRGPVGAGSGDMLGANNLSELTDINAAKIKLQLGAVNNTSDADKPVSIAAAAALDLKVDKSMIGAAGGVVPLGNDKIIPTEYFPSSLLGGVNYQGTWDAATNTPAIPAAMTANKGWYFRVSVAGTTNIGGLNQWDAGDWIISNGASWEKVDHTDQVLSVNGRQGNVTGLAELSGASFTGPLIRGAWDTGGFGRLNPDGLLIRSPGVIDIELSHASTGANPGVIRYDTNNKLDLRATAGVMANGQDIWTKGNLPNPASLGAAVNFNSIDFPDNIFVYADSAPNKNSFVVRTGVVGAERFFRFGANGNFYALTGTIFANGDKEVWHAGNLVRPVRSGDGNTYVISYDPGVGRYVFYVNGGGGAQMAVRYADEQFRDIRASREDGHGVIGFGNDYRNFIHFDGVTYNFSNGKQISLSNNLVLNENWSRVFIGGVAQGVKVISTGTPSDYPGVQNNDIWFQV